ncbi:MAG: nucleotidyl transferase AbiEii/AbiGii toxin family protein [Myxococcota bacterium]
MNRKYKSPRALKSAFMRRYQDEPRRQLILLMQRFVARVCLEIDSAVVKGGLGLELRLDVPRTTKDADIIISGSHELDQRLEAAGKIDLGDFLIFRVQPDKSTSIFHAPGMEYHGKRYVVQAFFADGNISPTASPDRKFKVEASIRSAAGYDTIESVWDGFDQISPAEIRIYSLPWQLAEKVHAYTDPRHRESENPDLMRPRDLLDLCRCAVAKSQVAQLQSRELRYALVRTFEHRKSRDPSLHDLPSTIPPLPADWIASFMEQVRHDDLPWKKPEEAHALAADFMDPVLDGRAAGTWHPEDRVWK